jgi:hypothetical protein
MFLKTLMNSVNNGHRVLQIYFRFNCTNLTANVLSTENLTTGNKTLMPTKNGFSHISTVNEKFLNVHDCFVFILRRKNKAVWIEQEKKVTLNKEW